MTYLSAPVLTIKHETDFAPMEPFFFSFLFTVATNCPHATYCKGLDKTQTSHISPSIAARIMFCSQVTIYCTCSDEIFFTQLLRSEN